MPRRLSPHRCRKKRDMLDLLRRWRRAVERKPSRREGANSPVLRIRICRGRVHTASTDQAEPVSAPRLHTLAVRALDTRCAETRDAAVSLTPAVFDVCCPTLGNALSAIGALLKARVAEGESALAINARGSPIGNTASVFQSSTIARVGLKADTLTDGSIEAPAVDASGLRGARSVSALRSPKRQSSPHRGCRCTRQPPYPCSTVLDT